MYDNKHDKMNYNITDGIKVYTGTTEYSIKKLKNNINHYSSRTKPDDKIFTEMIPSTLTAKGKFTNVCFNEEDIIDMLTVPNGGYILKICCNYGILENANPDYTKPAPRTRVSNRGRKPKTKPKSKRKLQGTGKFFSSQITFEIYNQETDKIYKIKLFRNGRFQVPGVNKPDMSDLVTPIKILRDYLREEFLDTNIEVSYFISVMRNYICKIQNRQLLIRLNELETLFKNKKELLDINPHYELVNDINKIKGVNYTEKIKEEIKKYIGEKYNEIGIAEIQNNCERYFGLILKFYRPVPWKMNKRTTIKILRSGKINIDGSNSVEESYELYHWLEYIFTKNFETILHNPEIIESDSEEYDIGSGESVYDDDLSE